jgi:hypothetical protein
LDDVVRERRSLSSSEPGPEESFVGLPESFFECGLKSRKILRRRSARRGGAE